MKQSELSDYQSTDDSQCPTCERTFKNQHGMRIHHAQAHGERLGIVSKTCIQCGSDYETLEIRADQSNYCSNDCKHLGRRSRVTNTCYQCGQSFEVPTCDADQKFCDKACVAASLRDAEPEEAPAWKGGRATLICEICEGSYEVKQHQTDWRVTCSYECFGEWRSRIPAEDHPRYKGGGSRTYYELVRRSLSDERWEQISRRWRKDNPICELCEEAPGFESSEAHHIIPVLAGGTNVDELLMTVCATCHKTVEVYTEQYTDRVLAPDRWTEADSTAVHEQSAD